MKGIDEPRLHLKRGTAILVTSFRLATFLVPLALATKVPPHQSAAGGTLQKLLIDAHDAVGPARLVIPADWSPFTVAVAYGTPERFRNYCPVAPTQMPAKLGLTAVSLRRCIRSKGHDSFADGRKRQH